MVKISPKKTLIAFTARLSFYIYCFIQLYAGLFFVTAALDDIPHAYVPIMAACLRWIPVYIYNRLRNSVLSISPHRRWIGILISIVSIIISAFLVEVIYPGYSVSGVHFFFNSFFEITLDIWPCIIMLAMEAAHKEGVGTDNMKVSVMRSAVE